MVSEWGFSSLTYEMLTVKGGYCMQETNKESYFSRCFTLSGEPLPEISHAEPVRITKEESSHRDLAYENMIWFLEKYLYDGYTEKKIQEDNQMSYMIGFNTKEYGILVSDSRETITIPGETIINDKKRKLLPHPSLPILVGYTGMYSYQGGDIEDFVIHIFKQSCDVNQVIQALSNLTWGIQENLQFNQYFNLHIMYIQNGEIQYQIIDNSYDTTKVTYARKPIVNQSGISMPFIKGDIGLDHYMERNVSAMKKAVSEIIISDEYPSVGGLIQCYVLKSDGSIVDFSE